MKGTHIGPPPSIFLQWTSRRPPVLAFALAAAAGVGLLGVRRAARGNADPLDVSWPLYLQIGSCVLTLFVASLSRRPFAAAFGLFFGLIMYMLFEGRAEYPIASAIALAIHGLLPALVGALCLVLIGRAVMSNSPRKHQ